jgi:hypothetical protein
MFDKILNAFKLSVMQLKVLLAVSVSLLGVMFYIGVKTNNFSRDFQDMKKNSEEIKQEISNLRTERKKDFKLIYNDMMNNNKNNNDLWNTKFNILIKYGSSNKEILMDLLKYEEQKKSILDDNIKNDRLNNYINYDEDSLKIKANKIE